MLVILIVHLVFNCDDPCIGCESGISILNIMTIILNVTTGMSSIG